MKRFISIMICFAMLLSATQIYASDYDLCDSAYMEDILSQEEKILYESEETIFYPNSDSANMKSGVYPIYTKFRTTQSSSGGLSQCDSATGVLSGVGAIVLSFWGGVPGMAVSTILSIVGIAASSNQNVQAVTYKSHIEYQKQGMARWSDEPAYTAWVISGKRNYYKHIMGAKLNSNGQWTTNTKDYLDSPASVAQGQFYNNSESWFKDQAYQRCQTGSLLLDYGW